MTETEVRHVLIHLQAIFPTANPEQLALLHDALLPHDREVVRKCADQHALESNFLNLADLRKSICAASGPTSAERHSTASKSIFEWLTKQRKDKEELEAHWKSREGRLLALPESDLRAMQEAVILEHPFLARHLENEEMRPWLVSLLIEKLDAPMPKKGESIPNSGV